MSNFSQSYSKRYILCIVITIILTPALQDCDVNLIIYAPTIESSYFRVASDSADRWDRFNFLPFVTTEATAILNLPSLTPPFNGDVNTESGNKLDSLTTSEKGTIPTFFVQTPGLSPITCFPSIVSIPPGFPIPFLPTFVPTLLWSTSIFHESIFSTPYPQNSPFSFMPVTGTEKGTFTQQFLSKVSNPSTVVSTATSQIDSGRTTLSGSLKLQKSDNQAKLLFIRRKRYKFQWYSAQVKVGR